VKFGLTGRDKEAIGPVKPNSLTIFQQKPGPPARIMIFSVRD
jgi:hypothetical protein